MIAAALYDWLLFGHIVAAMVWVGGGVVLAVLAVRVLRAGDAGRRRALRRQPARRSGRAVLAPATVAVLGLGIWMVLDSAAWDFGQLWVQLALGLFGGAFVIGAAHQSRAALGAERGAERGDDAEARRQLARWAWGYGVDRRCCSSSPPGTWSSSPGSNLRAVPTLLLVRHAQGSFRGADYDVLSERGHEQAAALADDLEAREVNVMRCWRARSPASSTPPLRSPSASHATSRLTRAGTSTRARRSSRATPRPACSRGLSASSRRCSTRRSWTGSRRKTAPGRRSGTVCGAP